MSRYTVQLRGAVTNSKKGCGGQIESQSQVFKPPKKAQKHKEMGPQNCTLDPTPKTPLDPPPLEIPYAQFGRLNPLLDAPGQGPSEILYADFLWVFFPRSNTRCFLNGVFQSGVFRVWSRSARAEGTKMFEKTGVWRHFLSLSRGSLLSQAEVRNMKNTVWKTPFGTRRNPKGDGRKGTGQKMS